MGHIAKLFFVIRHAKMAGTAAFIADATDNQCRDICICVFIIYMLSLGGMEALCFLVAGGLVLNKGGLIIF